MPAPEDTAQPVNRDAVILRIMGSFFSAFGLFVAVGLFWPQEPEARLVSAGASLSLLACGALAFFFAWRKSRA